MKTQGEDGIYKTRRKTSEETNPTDNLTSDQPPEKWENKLLQFKSPILWYFVWQPNKLMHPSVLCFKKYFVNNFMDYQKVSIREWLSSPVLTFSERQLNSEGKYDLKAPFSQMLDFLFRWINFILLVWKSCWLNLIILIPACASCSPAFSMMYPAYKLNKQGENIQPWWTPFPIWNQSFVSCPVLTVTSWPAYKNFSGGR